MDSIGKIVEEMRFAAINDWADKRDLTEWADRIGALTKEPNAWYSHNINGTAHGNLCFYGPKPAVQFREGQPFEWRPLFALFAAPPAPIVPDWYHKAVLELADRIDEANEQPIQISRKAADAIRAMLATEPEPKEQT